MNYMQQIIEKLNAGMEAAQSLQIQPTEYNCKRILTITGAMSEAARIAADMARALDEARGTADMARALDEARGTAEAARDTADIVDEIETPRALEEVDVDGLIPDDATGAEG